MKCSLVKHQH